MNSKKLLIIGSGDLGRRLADHLVPAGYQVTGLRRHPPEQSGPIVYQAADARDLASLEQQVAQGFDVILVTMTPSEPDDKGYRQAYVQTCENLVAALEHRGQQPRLVVYVSSTRVYGQGDGEWVDEASPTEPSGASGQRLLEAEEVIAESGFEHVIVRFSGIYGPGRDRLITQVRQGRATLSARYTNRIHADDCAGVLAHLVARRDKGLPLDRLYLASDDGPAPMAEVVNWLAMQMRVDRARFDPGGQGLGKRCRNGRLRATGYEFRYPDYRAGYAALLADNTIKP